MTLMRLRELTSCPHQSRVLITLEDTTGPHRITFYADADDARRLAREMARGPRACHPIFDFIQTLLTSWHAAPVRVVLEDVNGDGIGALVYLRQVEHRVLPTGRADPCAPHRRTRSARRFRALRGC